MGSPQLHRIEMCKHGMEAFGLPMNQEIQDCGIRWKVMATMIWDQSGILLVKFLEREATITAAVYGAALEYLQAPIRHLVLCF